MATPKLRLPEGHYLLSEIGEVLARRGCQAGCTLAWHNKNLAPTLECKGDCDGEDKHATKDESPARAGGLGGERSA